MRRQLWGSLLILILVATGLSGCSSAEGKGTESARNRLARQGPPPAPAKTPAETVERVTAGIADNHPEVLWYALPPSYRTDIERVIHTAAGKIDPELWNRTFSVGKKLTRVLNEKRKFILDHPMIASQLEDRDEVEKGWDGFVGLLQTVVDSEIADLDSMKTLDVELFLAGTGAQAMAQLEALSAMTPEDSWGAGMLELAKVKAEVVSMEGDRAQVILHGTKEAAAPKSWVRVEGHWLPQEIADGWAGWMAAADDALANFSGEMPPEDKQQFLMILNMADGALDTLLAADSQQEFESGVGALMAMAMSAMMQAAAQEMETASAAPQIQFTPSPSPSPPPSMRMPAAAPPVAARERPFRARPGEDVPRADVESFVGRVMRVSGDDGFDFVGKLKRTTSSTLVFERMVGGGSMEFEVDRDRVSGLRFD